MKITKKTKSPLLSRIDILAEINHSEKRTPSREEIKEELSKGLKADKKLILVDHIYTNYGDNKSEIIAYIYDSKETMEKIGKVKVEETPKVEEKTEVKEESKVEEKPTEEAPKEEKVEENGKKTSEE